MKSPAIGTFLYRGTIRHKHERTHSHKNMSFSEYINQKLLPLQEKRCTQDILGTG